MVITICNYKGGVGKTTTCHNLSIAKAMDNKKVLMIDLDSQMSLTKSCGIKPLKGTPTICDLIVAELNNIDYNVDDIKECIINLDKVDIIPCDRKMHICDKKIYDKSDTYVLNKILNKIKENYDYIFLDCPPTKTSICDAGLIASDNIIVPVESYFLGSEGLYEIIEDVEKMNKRYNKTIKISGIIITMFQNANICKNIKETICNTILKRNSNENSTNKIKVFSTQIPRSVKVAESNAVGKSIIEYNIKNNVSKAYLKLAKEI